MKVISIHQRDFNISSADLSKFLDTLASKNDLLWPNENWPPMILDNGLTENSRGGHGPIGYFVTEYIYGKILKFQFTRPEEYDGIHKFEIIELSDSRTKLKHTIDMDVTLKGLASWYLAIKWLHDALLEDCLDKVHNQINDDKVKTNWNLWVTILRKILSNKN